MQRVLVLLAMFLFTGGFLFQGNTAHAHEVYVLEKEEVQQALEMPSLNMIEIVREHLFQFILSGAITVLAILAVFFFSVFKPVERIINPLLHKVKHYAPTIAQATLGLALASFGIYGAAFGTELPFIDVFGIYAFSIQVVFGIVGLAFVFGIYPRIMSIIAGALLIPYLFHYGWYMLSYATYFGEVLTMILFGGSYALIKTKENRIERIIERHWHKYKFFILRIFFGVSLIFSSVYAKLIHSPLALATVEKYSLTSYFPFDAPFIVLGAMIIEILLGIFILIGFEIRFTSLVLLGFLTLSISFFGEAVWPHIILIGTALAMFTHGYDKYTLLARMKYCDDLEPIGCDIETN